MNKPTSQARIFLDEAVLDVIAITPTPEGIKRHEPDGYYETDCVRVPCTCTPTCAPVCKGECGCVACHAAFQDFGYDE